MLDSSSQCCQYYNREISVWFQKEIRKLHYYKAIVLSPSSPNLSATVFIFSLPLPQKPIVVLLVHISNTPTNSGPHPLLPHRNREEDLKKKKNLLARNLLQPLLLALWPHPNRSQTPGPSPPDMDPKRRQKRDSNPDGESRRYATRDQKAHEHPQ